MTEQYFSKRDPGLRDQQRVALMILNALNGDPVDRFGAFRVGIQKFGRLGLHTFLAAAEERSRFPLRLEVRERHDNEYPDAGLRRRRDRERRTEGIGQMVYGFMQQGISKRAAIAQARMALNQNLSERTFERELAAYRQLVRKRGYGDICEIPGTHISIVTLRKSDILRKGRPKKHTKRN